MTNTLVSLFSQRDDIVIVVRSVETRFTSWIKYDVHSETWKAYIGKFRRTLATEYAIIRYDNLEFIRVKLFPTLL